MAASPRIWVRFSLRSFLVIATVLIVCIGWRESVRRAHYRAINQLEQKGAGFFSEFEDPIGPNFIWPRLRLRGNSSNNFFRRKLMGEWLLESPLCITGNYQCNLTGPQFGNNDLHLLKDLLHLRGLELRGISLEPDDLRLLKYLRELKYLTLALPSFSDEHVENPHQLKQLEALSLAKKQASDAAIDSLKQALPDCKIEIY